MTSQDTQARVQPAKARRRRHRIGSVDGPAAVDVHVGSRIRIRRTLMGMSQVDLGRAVHLTFQQIQKYERGTNRVSASTLYDLAHALDVPVSFFFDDLADGLTAPGMPSGPGYARERETLELMRHYFTLDDTVRRAVYELVKRLSGQQSVGEV